MHTIEPIAYIHTPFKEKFAVPRQPRLAPSATAQIHLLGAMNSPDAVKGLTQFSHIWLLFLFSQNLDAGFKPTVRPPRLGGNARVGVLASRATFRPNGIGISAVELLGIRQDAGQVWLDIGSTDLVDNTPIIDIKPYLPYSDALPEATGGFAPDAPSTLDVAFSTNALRMIEHHPNRQQIMAVIEQVLAQDPRPAYKKGKADNKVYAVHLFEFNVQFSICHHNDDASTKFIQVGDITPV